MTVRNINTKEYAFVDFTRRAWLSNKDDFKLEGQVFTTGQETQKKSNEAFDTKGGKLVY